jgi:hypothetical protein
MDGDTWTFLGIIAYVVVVTWVARHVALDMDDRGKSGWLYGMLTFLVPPVGLVAWTVDRNSTRDAGKLLPQPGQPYSFLILLLIVVTFPWGLAIWLLANRARSAP